MPEQSWRWRAACLGVDPAAFFTRGPVSMRVATLCRRCPVRTHCLKLAMQAEGGGQLRERHGVFGGLSPSQRLALSQRQRTTVGAA